jgi:ribosomal protein S18 acetylase RimI-like enzyme
VIRTLAHADFDALHSAFVEAFSDYVVKMSPTREQLLEMLTRRGWVPEASVAEFDNERIVAFTINGIDAGLAYDTGTGVAPSHRRLGLGRALMEGSFQLLRERGCSRYALEVLEANEKAVELYRSCSFVETRRLQCWTFDRQTATPIESTSAIEETWWTSTPSWQNTSHSIARANDPHLIIGNEDCYAVLFPSNGDLAQLAVHPDSRRRRLGTRLLESAATIAGKPLRIINVDDGDETTARFLEHAGAQRTVRQIEMMKLL